MLTLGQVAFHSFLKIWREIAGFQPGKQSAFCHGGEWDLPGGIVLIASYHPSQQNTQTRKLTRPMFHDVFRRAREILSPKK